MTLSEVKNSLPGLNDVSFQLENGKRVPEHFHVTEVGLVTRRFIDCGGTMRQEQIVNFQLWNADDYEHRLKPAKLLNIIRLSEERLGITDDSEVEVEYQGETIGRYALAFDGQHFLLKSKTTACLAMDVCGLPQSDQKKPAASSCCAPGSSCQ